MLDRLKGRGQMKGSPWFSRSEAGREANILTSGTCYENYEMPDKRKMCT